ncbi:MAG: CcmD family protein [Gemmatimonadota bacterium]
MDNAGFLVAAYVVTFLVIGGYAVSLHRRLARARRDAAAPAAPPRGMA